MLEEAKALNGYTLHSLDGEIGKVQKFYEAGPVAQRSGMSIKPGPRDTAQARQDAAMKNIRFSIMLGGLAVMAMTTAGCLLFVVGAGAGVGTVAYYDNELRVACPVTVERAWAAATAAMQEMAYTTIPAETRQDATGGVVQGRNASDQIVRIRLTRVTETTTEIRVRVGAFATADDRRAENLLYEKIVKHF